MTMPNCYNVLGVAGIIALQRANRDIMLIV